jgi:GntR family transcriptional regulator/MocR family aminotransferase
MELILQLDSRSQQPLYRQLTQALKDAIADGRLLPGSVMPSVRTLGTSLSLSRATILKAYDELQVQGYLESRPGLGTFVKKNPPGVIDLSPPEPQEKMRQELSLSAYGERLLKCRAQETEGEQTADIFGREQHSSEEPVPAALWKRLVARFYDERNSEKPVTSRQSFGLVSLREAAANFLARSRAVRCDASRVMVFSGQESCFDLLCRLMLDPGDCVALENPGYHAIHQTIEANGGRVIAVPVDGEGICVEQLRSLKEKIKLVYITPSVLQPSGSQMSLERRRQLLDWASASGAFIIEDDFGCEYRQASNSVPSLQGLDENDSVIYLRCLSKVMAPMVRVGFMVVPECLKPLISFARKNFESQLPIWEQQALTAFINDGFLERRIKNSRDLYRERSYAVVFALTHYIGRKIVVSRMTGGTFVQVWFKSHLSDEQLTNAARQSGVPMEDTRSCYLHESVAGEFVISFKGWQENSINSKIMQFAYLLDCLESSERAASIDFSVAELVTAADQLGVLAGSEFADRLNIPALARQVDVLDSSNQTPVPVTTKLAVPS